MIVELIKSSAKDMGANGARLSGISMASPLDAAAPPVLRMIWQLGGADPLRAPTGISGRLYAPTQEWHSALDTAAPAVLDAEFLRAAWALGAWDVLRTERAPLSPGADPLLPGHGITAQLGSPYRITGIPDEEPALAVAPWARACARYGWLHWYCRPMWRAPEVRRRAWLAKDYTLDADGTRPPRDWLAKEPLGIGTDHQTIIRMGRAQRRPSPGTANVSDR